MHNSVIEATAKKYHYLLASKSPRRQFLLKELGLKFDVLTKEVEESFPPDLQQENIALYLCKKKAAAFEANLKDNMLVITADTIVWINNTVLNKPGDEAEAFRMLSMLSGNRHEVFTGVCLKSKTKEKAFYTRTEVDFRKLSDEDIYFYIHQYKPYDKAGAYGAQECLPAGMNPCSQEEIKFLEQIGKSDLIENSKTKAGESFNAIEKMNGSYFNVMGFPIKEFYEHLVEF